MCFSSIEKNACSVMRNTHIVVQNTYIGVMQNTDISFMQNTHTKC